MFIFGDYFIAGHATGGTSAVAQVTNYNLTIFKNGAAITGANSGFKVEQEMEIVTAGVSCIITLDADDYVELFITINITAGTNRVTNADFSGFKIIV